MRNGVIIQYWLLGTHALISFGNTYLEISLVYQAHVLNKLEA